MFKTMEKKSQSHLMGSQQETFLYSKLASGTAEWGGRGRGGGGGVLSNECHAILMDEWISFVLQTLTFSLFTYQREKPCSLVNLLYFILSKVDEGVPLTYPAKLMYI